MMRLGICREATSKKLDKLWKDRNGLLYCCFISADWLQQRLQRCKRQSYMFYGPDCSQWMQGRADSAR